MNTKKKYLPGEKYGKLTIIQEIDPYISPSGQKKRKVLCICDCGNSHEVVVDHFGVGDVSSWATSVINEGLNNV